MTPHTQILVLRYRYGYSIRRIAKITGIPKSTVHKRLKRRPAIYWDYFCRSQAALIQGPCTPGIKRKVPLITISPCQMKTRNSRDTCNRKAHLHTNK